MPIPDPREDTALDALITASLHLTEKDVSEEEAQAFLKNSLELSPEQEARLAIWQPDLFSRTQLPECATKEEETSQVSPELFAAMNRKNAENRHSIETEEELKRRRREALDRLQQKRRPAP